MFSQQRLPGVNQLRGTMKIHLMIIDPQHDFCDPNGSLFVPGADEDMKRLAEFIEKNYKKLDDIHCTLDSHRIVDISHPIWFKDSSGKHPSPFTIIEPEDMENGVWTTTQPSAYQKTLKYLKALKSRKRYPHCIWPEHCLIGTEGAKVVPEVIKSFHTWERERFGMVDFITKGSNPWTEHFSGVMAEVPDPEDIGTQLNSDLVNTLQEVDLVLWAGEARSHCLANTFRDVVNNFKDQGAIQKMCLLTDVCSDVPGFESLGESLIKEAVDRGARLATTKDVFR
jgi:nicotinamidase/pyrazinamidase